MPQSKFREKEPLTNERRISAIRWKRSPTSSRAAITQSRSCAPNSPPFVPRPASPTSAWLTFTYIPDRKCVELKSLKLYLQRFRNEGIFYENVTNSILDDLVAVLAPRRTHARGHLHPAGRNHDQGHCPV